MPQELKVHSVAVVSSDANLQADLYELVCSERSPVPVTDEDDPDEPLKFTTEQLLAIQSSEERPRVFEEFKMRPAVDEAVYEFELRSVLHKTSLGTIEVAQDGWTCSHPFKDLDAGVPRVQTPVLVLPCLPRAHDTLCQSELSGVGSGL